MAKHTYYVICKDTASGEYNTTPTQIVFTLNVNNPANTCATLTSNDRQNNNRRSTSGSGTNDSAYLWQAVEKGKREKFDQVDWYAGYQFSLGEDGTATELCGYFEEGEKNTVYLLTVLTKQLLRPKLRERGIGNV